LTVYEIRVAGRLDPSWSGWFADFTLTAEPDDTSPSSTAYSPESATSPSPSSPSHL